MHRWFEPSAAGSILFVLFLAFQGLCGDTTKMTTNVVQPGSETTTVKPVTITTFGAPTVLEIITLTEETPPQTGIRVRWVSFVGVLVIGWSATMALGRLMLDGGVKSRFARTLLPPRRHPALWLLAYLAAVPVLALPGAFIDTLHNGMRGLFSPDGPSAYPLLVLVLVFFGLPVVAIFLAVRRVLDRRAVGHLFETDAPPKPEVEWPF